MKNSQNRALQKILDSLASSAIKKLMRGRSVAQFIGLALIVLLVGTWLFINYLPENNSQFSQDHEDDKNNSFSSINVRALFETQKSGIMVVTSGNVTRILPDDKKGSQHQRFIIKTTDGLSLLVSHNIDLAPRVPIQIDDPIMIYGQYEWNSKGGLLHWTHHDPKNVHPEGWIEHKNKKYE